MSKTIDGVPRELLERLQAQTELGNDWDEVQALLAAPVVERQPDALSKGFYTTQTGGGKYEINIGYRTIDELHAADEQLRDLLKSRTSQLAPVAVARELLPIGEWMKIHGDWLKETFGHTVHSACLDKVKELNS